MPLGDISVLDIDVLLNTLSDLGITLSEEQRKYFEEYCRELIYADPEHAAKKILAAIEKLAKKKLSAKDKEKLIQAEKRNKWEDLLAKEKKHEFTRPINLEQARRIIAKAASRLGLNLNNKQIEKAARRFYTEIIPEENDLDRANTALLNVIKVGIAGGIRIIVLYNWGNLINIPDLNPYHGLAPIDQGNKLESALLHGDPVGIHFSAIMNIIANGTLNPNLIQFIKLNASSSLPTKNLLTEQSNPKQKKPIVHAPTLTLNPSSTNREEE